MTDESTVESAEPECAPSRCRPSFPLFPFVFPMMFPIGLMIFIGRRRSLRERALEMRIEQIEQRLDDLEAAHPADR
jgi:hypothetical protein